MNMNRSKHLCEVSVPLHLFLCVLVCKQTIHSRNIVQQYRKRACGGVVSGGSGVLHYFFSPQSLILQLTFLNL